MQTLSDPELYTDEFFGSLVHGKDLAGKSGDKFWREALRDTQEKTNAAPRPPVLDRLRDVRRNVVGGPVLHIPTGVSPIVNSVASELSTALRNHLSENFFERQEHMHRAFVLRLHAGNEGHRRRKRQGRRKGVNELVRWLSRQVNRKQSELVDFENFGERDRAATQRFDALGDEIKTELQRYAVAERAMLGLGDEDFVTKTWLRLKDPARVLRLLRWTWKALNEIEPFLDDRELNDLRAELGLRIRVFTICPKSKIQAANVPIDAHAFFLFGVSLGIWTKADRERFTGVTMIKQDLDVLERDLKAQNMAEDDIKKQLSTRRAELKRDVKKRARGEFWCKVFKLKKLRRGRRDLDFAGHVRTDGVSISVLFDRLDYSSVSRMTKNRRKAEDLRERAPDELAMQRIIGIDPGRRSICYATEEIVAAAPNDEARRRLFEALADFDGLPAMNVGGAGAGGAGADDAGADDGDDGGSDDGGADDGRGGSADGATTATTASTTTTRTTAAARTTPARTTSTSTTTTRTTTTSTTTTRTMTTSTTTTRAAPARTTTRWAAPARTTPDGVLGVEVGVARRRRRRRRRRWRRRRRGRGSRGARRARRSYKAYTLTRLVLPPRRHGRGQEAVPPLAQAPRRSRRLTSSASIRSRPRTSTCTKGTSTRTSTTSTRCGRRSCVRVGLGRSSACTAGSAGRFRSSSTASAAMRFLSSRTAPPPLGRADEASAQSP